MAQYTVEAFRWSGTGYNALYNTSYTAIMDDNDGAYNGATDGSETVSINGGAFNSTSGSPYAINVSFTDTGGNPHVETFYFFNTGGAWYFVPAPGSAFTVGATLGSYQNHTNGWNYGDVTCFVRGTRIETIEGPIRVEDLKAGIMIPTLDRGYKKLRLVLNRAIEAKELAANPKLRPVRISAWSLGGGLPTVDLLVSRQHRMLVTSNIAQRMFGQPEVLIAAIKLVELPGVYVDENLARVEYFHLLFDEHEVIYAEGAPTESLFTGPQALKSLPQASVDEIFEILPDIAALDYEPQAARLVPEGKRQKQLVARHVKNDRALVPI